MTGRDTDEDNITSFQPITAGQRCRGTPAITPTVKLMNSSRESTVFSLFHFYFIPTLTTDFSTQTNSFEVRIRKEM